MKTGPNLSRTASDRNSHAEPNLHPLRDNEAHAAGSGQRGGAQFQKWLSAQKLKSEHHKVTSSYPPADEQFSPVNHTHNTAVQGRVTSEHVSDQIGGDHCDRLVISRHGDGHDTDDSDFSPTLNTGNLQNDPLDTHSRSNSARVSRTPIPPEQFDALADHIIQRVKHELSVTPSPAVPPVEADSLISSSSVFVCHATPTQKNRLGFTPQAHSSLLDQKQQDVTEAWIRHNNTAMSRERSQISHHQCNGEY